MCYVTVKLDHGFWFLHKPIVPCELYIDVRDSQLIGISGDTRVVLPVFAIGVGLSTFDKASVHYYVQSHIQINEYRDRVLLHGAGAQMNRSGSCNRLVGLHFKTMSGIDYMNIGDVKLATSIVASEGYGYSDQFGQKVLWFIQVKEVTW